MKDFLLITFVAGVMLIGVLKAVVESNPLPKLPAHSISYCPSSPPAEPGERKGGPWLQCETIFHQQDI